MTSEIADEFKRIARGLSSLRFEKDPHPEIGRPKTSHLIDPILVAGTRGYLVKICTQINGCYESSYYDGCAVMIRRFIETLIIETFEEKGLSASIQNTTGDYYYLKDLIAATLNEKSWNLGRNARKALPNLKEVGDKSAHSRRFCAIKSDIDSLKSDLRTVTQELIHLSGLK